MKKPTVNQGHAGRRTIQDNQEVNRMNQPSPMSEDDNSLQICQDSSNNLTLAEDKSSMIGPGIDHSFSDCDSTQCDVTVSFDGPDACSSVNQSFPLNCLWGANTLSRTSSTGMPAAPGGYPAQVFQQPSHPMQPQSFAVPVMAFPQFNTQLPFPDKSGKIPQPSFVYGNSPTYQTPPPSPFNVATGGFPSVYVSPAGLITVLLKHDIAVEMTVERNIRVVNHRHKAVASTNNRGNTNCVYHVAAKVFQDGTKTEVEVFGERRARMQPDGILFSSGMEVYLLDEDHIVPSQFCFNDMSKDISVNVLFNSEASFTNDVLLKCEEITKGSRYFYHKNGSATIIINNIRIHQDQFGEVQVISGPKFISTSPIYGNIYLQTHFVDISVQVKLFSSSFLEEL